MPRKRPKTELDRPAYRPTARMIAPERLEPFLDQLHLRRIVSRYGLSDVQLALALIAEDGRREMIERRSQEVRDAWKEKLRPMAPVRLPHAEVPSARESRSKPGYRSHLEEHLDKLIRRQERARELQDGLAVILETNNDIRKAQFAEIVHRATEGQTAAEIAAAIGISVRTVESRLAEVRQAAVEKEEQELASAS